MRLAVALAIAVTLSGCAASADPEVHVLAPGKWGTGEVLADLGAMVERVPSLAGAETVSYLAGPAREPDGAREITVPGPTDLWIDAVVTFAPEDDTASNECGSIDAVSEPDVVPQLASEVGDGPWRQCEPGAFSGQGWRVSAAFSETSNTVILNLRTF